MALQTPKFGLDMGGVTFKCNVVLESSVDSGVTCDSVLHHDGSVLVSSSGTVGESTSVAKFTFATDPLITASCALAMGTNKITGLGDPSSAQDAATKNYCDTTFLALAGGTMVGNITMADDGTIGVASAYLTFDSSPTPQTITVTGDLHFTDHVIDHAANSFVLRATTSDGSDSATILLEGGGAASSGRGAYIQIEGVEAGGDLVLIPGSGGQLSLYGSGVGMVIDANVTLSKTVDMNSNTIVGVASITINEDGWVGNSVSTERLVFDGTGGALTVTAANLFMGSNGIGNNGSVLTFGAGVNPWCTLAGHLIVSAGDLLLGVHDSTAGELIVYGGSTGTTGGTVYLYTGASHDTSINRYIFQVYEDDLQFIQHTTTKLTLVGADGTWLFGAAVGMGSNAITGVASITIDEDGWVGIGVSSERLVFDGTGGIIEIQGAHTLHVGSNEAQFGDSGTKIAQRANSYLALTADGAVEIFGILELEATTSATGHITQAGTRVFHTYGTENVFGGSVSGNFTLTGSRNTALGHDTMPVLTSGWRNTVGGHSAGIGLTSGAGNTLLGYFAGASLTTTNTCVMIGYTAGRWETGPNKLFIDYNARTNEADGRVKALVYGIFDAATANQELHFNANVYVLENLSVLGQNELRFYEGANYIGFEAPALAADQIWVLPPADGITGEVLTTDGAGNLSWTANASEKTWAFKSRDANTGTNYIGGFYKFATSANDFNPATTFGTANASYAAHVFLVQAAGASGGTDTVIRVTGTSIDDQGNRTAADFEDVTVDDAGAAGTYYETTVKWIGQVSIEKQSGPDLLCNYGFCKYWDNNNTDFKVVGVEATWLGAQNDATPDILLRHHTATGWTYNAGAAPTPPAAIVSMAGDHVTEIQIRTDEEGAWKRDNLSTDVDGSGIEGTIIELVTTANRTYAIGNFLVRITPQ